MMFQVLMFLFVFAVLPAALCWHARSLLAEVAYGNNSINSAVRGPSNSADIVRDVSPLAESYSSIPDGNHDATERDQQDDMRSKSQGASTEQERQLDTAQNHVAQQPMRRTNNHQRFTR